MLRRSGQKTAESQLPLPQLTDRDRRVAILVQFRLGSTASACHQTLLTALGDQAPSQAMVYSWFGRFRCGSTTLDDEPREGRPSSTVTDAVVAAIHHHVDEDRRVTLRWLERLVGVSHSTIVKILHEHLGMRKLSARWVPHRLSPEQMQARVGFAQLMLARFDGGRSKLVDNILTGDETWVYFYDPETKEQSRQWVTNEEDTPLKFRRERSVGKVMAAVFFRRCGILPPVLLEYGATVTADWYCAVCLPQVLQSLAQERPKMREKGIFLHQDNAPAHRARTTQDFLQSTQLVQLPHPAYSPDLAPADFFLFPRMKKNLKGRHFNSREELVIALQAELDRFSGADLRGCFEAWFQRLQKCLDLAGNYVEK